MSKLRHSLTLFGFTGPYCRGEMNLEQCIAKAKELGYDGIEMVAAQMMPSYPFSDPKWNDYFKGLCREYDVKPVCYSAYIDQGLRSDRDLNEREILQFTLNDLEAAHDMGFEICRSQFSITPKVMEQALPYAEAYGIHLAIEMHAPHTPSTPIWQEYLELFQRKNSPYLGIVPDYSSFMEALPANYLDTTPEGREKNIKKQLMTDFNAMAPAEKLYEDAKVLGDAGRAFVDGMFHVAQRDKVEYDGLKEFLPYTKYVHGKYYFIDENLTCKDINFPKLLKMLKDMDYSGYLCTEFEGNKYTPNIDDIEQIRRHLKMTDQIWESL